MVARKKRPQYVELSGEPEDERIEVIGRVVMENNKTIAFMTDADPGKADRYIKKLKQRFPGIRVIERLNGPTRGVVTVKVGPPEGASSK